jgi:hypothetical protein
MFGFYQISAGVDLIRRHVAESHNIRGRRCVGQTVRDENVMRLMRLT